MNFKEAYQDDLEEAFFDLDEFASEHIIDGKRVNVILTGTELRDARETRNNRKSSLNPKETSINNEMLTLYIRERDIKRKVTVNAIIELDGETMWINGVKHLKDMYRLLLGRNKV